MNIVLLILSSLLMLSVGFFFVVRGMKDADEDDVVPISDIKELKELNKIYAPEEKPVPTPLPLTEHLVADAINSPGASTEETHLAKDEGKIISLTKEIEMLRAQIEEQAQEANEKVVCITKERDDLLVTLKKEVSLENVGMSESDSDIAKQKDLELPAEDSNENKELIEENDSLRVQLLGKDDKLKKLKEEFDSIQAAGDSAKGVNAEQIANFQEELEELKVQNQELLESNKAIDRVLDEKKEIEQISESKDKTIDELESQRNVLGEELEELKGRSVGSEEQLAIENRALIAQVEERERIIVQMQSDIDGLNNQVEEAGSVLAETPCAEVEESVSDEEESQETNNVEAEILAEIEKLKKFNESLLERENLLQYELTKSKAQSEPNFLKKLSLFLCFAFSFISEYE